MSMAKSIGLLGGFVVVLFAITTLTRGAPPLLRKGASSSSGSGVFERPLWLSSDLYSRAIRVEDSIVGLKLEWDSPLIPGNALTESIQYSWSVAYNIRDISGSLGPHEFVVWGEARDGSTVIEHFELAPPVGSHYYSDTTSPMPVYSVVGGGPYLPPSERVAANPPVREELYRGVALGQDVLVANDPNRRFSYLISRDLEGLHCIEWATGGMTGYDFGSDGSLLAFAQSAQVQAHSTEGDKLKVVLALNDSDADYILLSDYDGDGLFDGHQVVDEQGYSLLGYPDLWVNDYVAHLSYLSPQ